MKYKIQVYEVWVRTCEIEADSEDEAVENMEEGTTDTDSTEYVSAQSIHIEEIV